MKIAVVNFNSNNNIYKNVLLMKKYIFKAIEDRVNFIIFPELCLTGYEYYMTDTKVLDEKKLSSIINSFLKISKENNIYICFGSPYFIKEKIYNSAIIVCPNGIVRVYNKIHLYGDEHKIFSKGTSPLILNTEYGKLGFGICYDTVSFPELIRYYAYNGVNLYINIWAIKLFNIKESQDYIKRIMEYHVQSNGIYLASSNVCGVQNNERFLGGSCVLGPDIINECPVHYYCNSKLLKEENIFIADIKLEENLRFIYDGNRFNSNPDFNINLYKCWYT